MNQKKKVKTKQDKKGGERARQGNEEEDFQGFGRTEMLEIAMDHRVF